MRRVLGNDHPDTLRAMHTLANDYTIDRKLEDASSLCVEALEGRRRVLGETHSDTLKSEFLLAIGYWYQGKSEEAGPIFEHVLQCRRHALGDDHPDTTRTAEYLILILAPIVRTESQDAAFDRSLIEKQITLFDALALLQRFDEAESLVISLELDRGNLAALSRDVEPSIVAKYFQSVIDLYDAWEKLDEVANRRTKLLELRLEFGIVEMPKESVRPPRPPAEQTNERPSR